MAPKASAAKKEMASKTSLPCLERTVQFEPAFLESEFSLSEYEQVKATLARHGWLKFVTTLPDAFLITPVQQFYDTLRQNSVTGEFHAIITVHTKADGTEKEDCEINVSRALRSLYRLPASGPNPTSSSTEEADAQIAPVLEGGVVPPGLLKVVSLLPAYKPLARVIQKSWFGNTGSLEQVSNTQKQILGALLQNGPYNWENAYLHFLLSEKTPVKATKTLRQGTRVSAIILEATKDLPVFWTNSLTTSRPSNVLLKLPRTILKKGEVEEEGAASASESENLLSKIPMKATVPRRHRSTVIEKKKSQKISIPIPGKLSTVAVEPTISTIKTVQIPASSTVPHTDIPEAELTSVSKDPSTIEDLTSAVASEPSKTKRRLVKASTKLKVSRDKDLAVAVAEHEARLSKVAEFSIFA